MNLRIEALSKDNKLDLTRLLEGADFDHAPEWKGCFCRFYHTSCSFPEWIKRTPETNKNETLLEVEQGNMKGYLAYADDLVVGWVNANDLRSYPRLASVWEDLPSGIKIALTICFVVHPKYRQTGIAGKLLDKAIAGFRQEGFDAAIALPFEDLKAERMYRGRIAMYEKRGYVRRKEENGIVLLYKDLSIPEGDGSS